MAFDTSGSGVFGASSDSSSFLNTQVSERSFTFYTSVLAQVFVFIFLYGLTKTLLLVWRSVQWVNVFFLRASSLPRYLENRDRKPWAFVTASSDGVGKGFAEALASKGFSVLLHGRNETKLTALASSLGKKYPDSGFKFVVADATNSHGMKQAIERIAETANKLPGPLAVLVNSVGGTACLPRNWMGMHEFEPAQVDAVFNMNARFTTQVTRALMPALIAAKPALIINISSAAGQFGIPYLAAYSGTKAYIERWSQALSQECAIERNDVEVICFNMGLTTGTAATMQEESLMVPSADTVAKGALQKVGCGYFGIQPCIGHWFAGLLVDFGPEFMISAILRSVALNGRMEDRQKLDKAK